MRTKAFLYSVNKGLWFYKITVAMTILMAIGCAATGYIQTDLVEDIKIERSTIKNSAVEKCIVKVLARTSYKCQTKK